MNKFEERLKKVQTYQETIQKKEDEKIKKLKEREKELKKQIKKLTPRVKQLIELGNECLNNNVPLRFNYVREKNGKQNLFELNFIKTGESTGFLKTNDEIKYVGTGPTSYSGIKIDTNGETSSFQNDTVKYRIKYYEKFLREFEPFETFFYSYIDHLNEDKTMRVIDEGEIIWEQQPNT